MQFILFFLLIFSSASSDEIVEFEVKKDANGYNLVYETEDCMMNYILEDLEDQLNKGEYRSFFSADVIEGKIQNGEVICVYELNNIRAFDSRKQNFLEYIEENAYPVYYVPMMTSKDYTYTFIKYVQYDDVITHGTMSFDYHNLAHLLGIDLRRTYITSDDFKLINIRDWPSVTGIVMDDQIIPFIWEDRGFYETSGEKISIDTLVASYKKYYLVKTIKRYSPLLIIGGILMMCFYTIWRILRRWTKKKHGISK